ncbi:hypothetical protein V8C86DRAFT_3173779, partial [Haematococcus lacustris]
VGLTAHCCWLCPCRPGGGGRARPVLPSPRLIGLQMRPFALVSASNATAQQASLPGAPQMTSASGRWHEASGDEPGPQPRLTQTSPHPSNFHAGTSTAAQAQLQSQLQTLAWPQPVSATTSRSSSPHSWQPVPQSDVDVLAAPSTAQSGPHRGYGMLAPCSLTRPPSPTHTSHLRSSSHSSGGAGPGALNGFGSVRNSSNWGSGDSGAGVGSGTASPLNARWPPPPSPGPSPRPCPAPRAPVTPPRIPLALPTWGAPSSNCTPSCSPCASPPPLPPPQARPPAPPAPLAPHNPAHHSPAPSSRASSHRGSYGGGSVSDDDVGPACRICLDLVKEGDLAAGRVLRLGCHCSQLSMNTMHVDCALRWFSVRRNTQCEVCGQEATGLTADIKAHVR